MIVSIVVAGLCTVRSLTVWDPHTFPHGILLQAGERVELARPEQVLRGDGYPDTEKLRKLLCSAKSSQP